MSINSRNKRKGKLRHRHEFSSLGGAKHLGETIRMFVPKETALIAALTKKSPMTMSMVNAMMLRLSRT